MSSNQALLEAQVRHQVLLLRRGAGLANEIIPEIERLIEQVIARVTNTPDQRARQRAMLSELRTILAESYSAIGDTAMAGAVEIAEYEAGYQVKLLDKHATVAFAGPSIEQIASSVRNDLMDLGPGQQMTIRQALDQFGEKKSRQVVQAISDGIAQQQTNAEIAQALRPMVDLQKRQVDALVRTVSNGAADFAKREVYRENADLLEGERYVATLDSRTTLTCMSRDGQIYPVGQGPSCPAHWQCRSVRVPVVRKDLQIPGFEGERPAVGSDGTTTVSSRMTYTGFLKNQDAAYQNDVLGLERAKLFRAGKLTLKDMVNDLGGPLTLAQLKAREL